MEDNDISSQLIKAPWRVLQRRSTNSALFLNLISGQLVAIVSVSTCICASKLLIECNFNVPLFILGCFYAFFLIIWLTFIHSFSAITYPVLLTAIIESQALFLHILSFKYVHFKYPFIINTTSIFWRLLISFLFTSNSKFNWKHFMSVIVIALGVAAILYGSIAIFDFTWEHDDFSVGITICFVSAFLFGMQDVLNDAFLKNGQAVYEYLFWYAFIGLIICGAEGSVLGEHQLFDKSEISVKSSNVLNSTLLRWTMCWLNFLDVS